LKELAVCEDFAFEEQSLAVSGGCGWLAGEDRFESRDRIRGRGRDGERVCRFKRLDGKLDRRCGSAWRG
jgi:hypothetical protein